MTALNVRTLGGIYIEKNGEQLDDKMGLKALALLCLLLTAPERSMRKNKAISMLWPDSDEDASRNNLRYNLWNIRKIIGDEAGESLVLTDKNNLRINPAYPVSVDLLFLKTFDAGTAYTEETLKTYRSCVRGEYLEGFYIKGCMEFSDLMLMERITCQNLQTQILEKLCILYQNNNNHSRCMEVLRELLLIDPYNEKFACSMMKHMAEAGQYANTLAFYRKFTENIRKDLNLPPSPELKRLHQEIAGGKYGKQETGGQWEHGQRYTQREAAPAERMKLAERAITWSGKRPESDARGPAATAQVLAGEPSTGEHAQILEIQVLCLPAVEYFFMAECLAQISARLGVQLHAEVAAGVLQDLSFLYPQLAEETVPCFVPQVRLISGFHQMLAALSGKRRLQIIIEDRMELDGPSKSFVQLLEHRPIEGVTVISMK